MVSWETLPTLKFPSICLWMWTHRLQSEFDIPLRLSASIIVTLPTKAYSNENMQTDDRPCFMFNLVKLRLMRCNETLIIMILVQSMPSHVRNCSRIQNIESDGFWILCKIQIKKIDEWNEYLRRETVWRFTEKFLRRIKTFSKILRREILCPRA